MSVVVDFLAFSKFCVPSSCPSLFGGGGISPPALPWGRHPKCRGSGDRSLWPREHGGTFLCLFVLWVAPALPYCATAPGLSERGAPQLCVGANPSPRLTSESRRGTDPKRPWNRQHHKGIQFMLQSTEGEAELFLTHPKQADRPLEQTRVLQKLKEDVLLEVSRHNLSEWQQTPTPSQPRCRGYETSSVRAARWLCSLGRGVQPCGECAR